MTFPSQFNYYQGKFAAGKLMELFIACQKLTCNLRPWLLASLLLGSTLLKAQTYTGTLYLTTQAQINGFNYKEVTGDIQVKGAGITDLKPLSSLTRIGGFLDISNNPDLTNLAGLENLAYVGGNFYMTSNSALTTLAGLGNVAFVGGDLFIYNNTRLAQCCQLQPIIQATKGAVTITGNATNCNSKAEIRNACTPSQVCVGDVTLRTQAEVDAFNCSEISGNLTIVPSYNNNDITDLEPLARLTKVQGNLTFQLRWVGLAGLRNLRSVGGNLDITYFRGKNLAGLESLTSVGGKLYLFANTELTSLKGLDNLTSVGELNIDWGQKITSLEGLGKLTTVKGDFLIDNNEDLASLQGLESLTSIGGSFYISYIGKLSNLTGLEKLTSIGQDFSPPAYSPNLTSLAGLERLTTIGGNVKVMDYLSNITSLKGLDNLSSIGGNLTLGSSKLLSLAGLEKLTSVGRDFEIDRSNSLTNFAGLLSLTSVGGSLTITRNQNLSSIEGLQKLASLAYLDIRYNPNLSQCCLLLPVIAATKNYVQISDNAASCRSREEIGTACAPVISSQPQAVTVCAGQGATFRVEASGTGLSYQWQKNGTDIPGATGAVYTVTAAMQADAGSYSAAVNGAYGLRTASDKALLSVNTPVKPVVTPSGATTFCSGGNVTLSAPGGFATYTWSNGAATRFITVDQSAAYYVMGTDANGCSSVASDATSVTVNPLPARPAISANGPLLFYTGGSVTLSATAAASYLWSTGATTQSITVTTDGSYSVSAINGSGCKSIASEALTVQVTPAAISVSHLDGDHGQLTNSTISPYMQLNNEGKTPLAFKDVTIRYWLTVEDFAPVTNLNIDWAQIGNSKVKMKYVKLGQPLQGAYGYVEYSFDASAGTLAANNNSGPIQSRIAKSDWTNFNEANDYSYASSSVYAKNGRITVYVNGSRVWGNEPQGMTPVQLLKTYSQDNSSGKTTNSIAAWLKLNNEGNTPVSFKDITIRYWFTADGTASLNYSLDYTPLGNNNVKYKFVKLSTPVPSADTYLELGFAAADSLYPGSTTGNIQQRISKSDWSNFNQLNDHSYKSAASMIENANVTVYIKGALVYGTEPASNQGQAMKLNAANESLSMTLKEEEAGDLGVTVLNNPVRGSEVEYIVRGASGKQIQVTLMDVQGKVLNMQQLENAGPQQRLRIPVNNNASGILFLRVSTLGQLKTARIMRSN